VVVLCLGEKKEWSGENASRSTIALPDIQYELLKNISKVGKPVVLVLSSGRPVDLSAMEPSADAILEIWQPGTMGGHAVAGLLSGRYNPSGKLPVTFPYTTGQIPIYYNHNMTGRPYNGTETMLYDIPLRAGQTSLGNTSYWLDSTFEPEFPFGYGLTYTTFEYGPT
jgi:beta-glucosidase